MCNNHSVALLGSFKCPCSARPLLLLLRGAPGPEALGDVPVREVLQDPLGEGQRLQLVRGHRMAQDGSAQVAQAGHRPGRLPEPHVAVSGSAGGGGGGCTVSVSKHEETWEPAPEPWWLSLLWKCHCLNSVIRFLNWESSSSILQCCIVGNTCSIMSLGKQLFLSLSVMSLSVIIGFSSVWFAQFKQQEFVKFLLKHVLMPQMKLIHVRNVFPPHTHF